MQDILKFLEEKEPEDAFCVVRVSGRSLSKEALSVLSLDRPL